MRINDGRIMADFLEREKRQYIIPVYQRNYEWDKDQCIKLFEDIVEVSKTSNKHFCGSIVYCLVRGDNDIYRYVVIDGQQRITTIYLLLKALVDCSDDEYAKNDIIRKMINTDPFKKYTVDDSTKLKLKPIRSDNKQLLLLMENKYDDIDKSSGIWKNYNLFCELIKNKLNEGITIEQIKQGLDKLICADIALDDYDNAQEIFERINSTGVPLSLSDKIRNFLLMVDENQEELYDEYWSVIEELVDRDSMTQYFLHYLNLVVDGFPKESEAYDVFKKLFYDENYTKVSMLEELKHYAKYYHDFTVCDGDYCDSINESLRKLKLLKQTTLYPFLFKVFDDYNNKVLDLNELDRVVRFLLNYSIRRIVCEVGSNSLRGLYKTLYSRIFNREENKEHYYDALVSFLQQLTSKDALIDDEELDLALKQNNLYRKPILCKLLLDLVENSGKEKVSIDKLTIEHIMPQSKNLGKNWISMLGSNWEEVRTTYLHTLGNLTLTAYNSELSDKTFAEKKNMYFSSTLTKVKTLNEEIYQNDIWNEEIIVKRANRLSKIIVDKLEVDEPQVLVDFSDPRFKPYTCENTENATNKVLSYFTLCGENINCNTFSDMLSIVIDRLYNMDSSIIDDLAKSNDPLCDSKLPFFSYDYSLYKRYGNVANSKLFHRSGFSSSQVIWFIRNILDKYEIDYDDFIYYAREW